MSRLQTITLDCGMPLIVEEIPGVRSVGVAWYIPAGSATDPEPRQGLCAMWSELLFRGSGDLDSRAQADALDRLGISRGAEVGTQFLNLGFTLTGDRLLDALPLIADIVLRPRLDEESVEPVRDLSLQAIQSLQDDPHERAALAARQRHNPSPINRSGLGTVEGLGAITRDDLLTGWQRRALPGRSILAVAGAVDAAGGAREIARRLNSLLDAWRGIPADIPIGTASAKGTYHHVADKSSQVQIILVHDAPPEPHQDSNSERVVSSVLSGGMSARLFTEVREKRGLCYSVSESYAADKEYGRCVAYVGTTPERAQQSLDVLLAELERIDGSPGQGGGITQEELDVALIGIKSRIIFSGESTSARAQALAGDHYKRGRPRTLDEIAAAFDALTLDDINAYLARRTLGPTTIVTLGPTPLNPPTK